MMKLDLLRGRHGCLLSFRTFACILFAQDFVESNTRAPYASTHRAAGGQLDGRVAARGGLSVLNGERQAAAPWHGAGQLLFLRLPLLQVFGHLGWAAAAAAGRGRRRTRLPARLLGQPPGGQPASRACFASTRISPLLTRPLP